MRGRSALAGRPTLAGAHPAPAERPTGLSETLLLAVEFLVRVEGASGIVHMLGHGPHVAGFDEATGCLGVIVQGAVKDIGECLGALSLGERIAPGFVLQVAACGGGFGGDAVGEGLQQGVVVHQALEATEHIGAHGPRGFDQAVNELHIRHGSAVFVGGNIHAVDALCHEAHECSGDLVDARIAGDLSLIHI